jgi:hypothetical protein
MLEGRKAVELPNGDYSEDDTQEEGEEEGKEDWGEGKGRGEGRSRSSTNNTNTGGAAGGGGGSSSGSYSGRLPFVPPDMFDNLHERTMNQWAYSSEGTHWKHWGIEDGLRFLAPVRVLNHR